EGVDVLPFLALLVKLLDGIEDLSEVRSPAHHLDRFALGSVLRVPDPERRKRRLAILGIGLATLVDRALGRIQQVRLRDVALQGELFANDFLAVHTTSQMVARAPDG